MKNSKIIFFTTWVALTMLPMFCSAQYFQALFDVDSTQDWAQDIFLNPDNSYFTIASSFNSRTLKWEFASMTIAPDGLSIVNKKILTTNYYYPFPGIPGEVRKLPGGNYIVPLTLQNPNIDYANSNAGFMKINPIGDTIFIKSCFDTSVNFTALLCASLLGNTHVIAGGLIAGNTSDYSSGLIVCADTFGDTIWTKSYLIDTGHQTMINTVEPIDNWRILVGATRDTRIFYPTTSETIDFNAPWFLVIDTNGNILKDTLWRYTDYWEHLVGVEGGHLYKDKNGGYFHYGNKSDIVNYSNLSGSLHNCPEYFAHLDTDFRITWIDSFPFSDTFGERLIYKMLQTADSDYILAGAYVKDSVTGIGFGWMAKIDKHGGILWQRTYLNDSDQPEYIEDVIEKPNHGLVFIGQSFNDTTPAWHNYLDVWLVGTDSLGCDVGGCEYPTGVRGVVSGEQEASFSVYPNPANTLINFQFSTPIDATIKITNIEGQILETVQVNSATMATLNIASFPPGMYVYQVVTKAETQVGKIIKE